MAKIIRDGGFYRLTLGIAIPIALQNSIGFLVNMVDTLMLGAVGQTQLSASQLANQPFFIFSLLCFGLAGGANVLCSQYWGKKDMVTIRKVMSIVLWIAIIMSFVFAAAVLIFPTQTMMIYSNEPAVIEAGASYLRIIGFSYFFFGITSTFTGAVRSVGIVKISVIASCCSLVTNIFLNWVFIFGNLGAPEMGIQGAALATLVARIVEFTVALIYLLGFDKRLAFRVKHLFQIERWLIRDFITTSIPVVLNELMWSIGTSMHSIVLGRLGAAAVSASAVVNVVQQLATIVIFGIANSATVVIGRYVGEGDNERVKDVAATFRLISYILGVFAMVIIFLCRNVVTDFYNLPEETNELVCQLMIISGVIVFFISISGISVVGILRGAGDTKFSLYTEIITLWGIAVPLGFITGLWLQLPVVVVFACMKLDEPAKGIICFIRMRGKKWIKNVTRDQDAIQELEQAETTAKS